MDRRKEEYRAELLKMDEAQLRTQLNLAYAARSADPEMAEVVEQEIRGVAASKGIQL